MRGIIRWILGWVFRTKMIGRERLQFDGPALVLPNHVSFLDAVFLYAYLPKGVCFVVNTYIADQIGFVLRWVDHITIDQMNPYSLKKIVNIVREGRPVVIFPEGRISRTGSLMKVYSGIGFIAMKTGATLHPVILRGLEFSKLSRVTDKMRSRWFPPTLLYCGEAVRFSVATELSFREQKKLFSDRILDLLQRAMFEARQLEAGYTNVFDKLLQAGERHGYGVPIVEDVTGRLTYRKLIAGSYALGDALGGHLAGEETIGVLLPNSNGHLVTLFALFYQGKTPAILNFSVGAANCLHCCAIAGVKTVLTSRVFIERGKLEPLTEHLAENVRLIYLEDIKADMGLADRLRGLWQLLRQTPAARAGQLVLFTSGSEGRPKGVVLRHEHILANLQQMSSVIDYHARDKMLNALPMFHSFGLTAGTLLPVLNGVPVFLYPTPLHYKIIPEIAYDRNATILLGTPTFLQGYGKYAHVYDFYSLRYVLAGGEKLKEEVRQLWQDKFGLRILEGYGTTETGPVLSLNTPLFHQPGTVGRFLPGIDWRLEPVPGIEEGGCLWVKGPNVMAGYLRHEQGFVPVGEWYDCGDVVSVDAGGFIRIQSRLKRFAKVSGEMISLDAVEKAAEACFGTARNGAVNIPDEKKGEKIFLYTQCQTASKPRLREYLRQTKQTMLALPVQVIILEKLPVLGSGKIDYMRLKALAEKEGDGDEE